MSQPFTSRRSRWVRAGCAALLAAAAAAVPLNVPVAGAEAGNRVELPDQARVVAVDHVVPHISTVPANAGTAVGLQLRERVRPGVEGRAQHTANPAVLFIPGSATPSAPAYDLSFEDYSWMAHLARSGFDVFALDLTGYGHSPQPKMATPAT